MAVSHVFTSPVADFTGTVTVFDSNGATATTNATALVRPSNWNSVHNQFMTISGNTAGQSTASGTNIVLQGGNNVTLSVTDQTIVFSAQSQSVQTQGMVSVQGSTGAISFANSNGITFGGNASTITASHNGLTSQSNQAFSAPGGSSAFQTLVFANSQGVSFSNSNGSVVASVATNYAASDHSHGNPTLNLTNLSGTTASNSAGLTLSLSAANQAFSAAGGSSAFQTLVFADSQGISFSNSNGSVVGTVRTNYAASDHSHGNPTLALTNLSGTTASNSAGLTLSLSAANPGGGAAFSAGISGGNTSGDTGTVSNQIVFAGGNNITVSGSTNAGGMSVTISGANAGGAQTGISGIIVSNTTYTSGTVSFSNANGISFGSSAGQAITASYTVPSTAGLISAIGVTGSNGNFTTTGISFSNANGMSFGTSAGSAVTASYTVPTVTNSSWTVSDNGTSGTVGRLAFTNLNGITLSLSTGAGGSHTIVGSHNALTSQSNQAFSADASSTFQTLVFQNSNGVSFSNNAGALRITHGLAGTATAITGGASMTVNSGGISFNGTALAGTGTTFNGTNISGSMTLNTAGLRLDLSGGAGGGGGVGLSAGTQSVSTGTVVFSNSNGITFGMSGSSQITASYNSTQFAGTGTTFAGANISASMTLNSNGLNLSASVAAPGAAAEQNAINLLGANTAGNTTATGSTIGFSGVNLTLSGTNASQVVFSAPATSSIVGANGVSISTDGSTISVMLQTRSGHDPFGPGAEVVYGNQGQATLAIVPIDNVINFQFDRICIPVQVSNASNSSNSATHSWWVGIYTKTASTLSLLTSTSTSHNFTASGTVGSYSLFAGPRLLTIPITSTLARNDYWIGIINRTTTGGGAGMTINQGLASQPNSAFSGIYGAASNATLQQKLGMGVYTASTSGMPSSIGFSQINGSGSLAIRPPMFYFTSGTV